MSRWDDSRWYETASKKPPPTHGIKVKAAGTTWWGQRWIEALQDVLKGDSARLARGRTYARAGRTHDLVVKGGDVTARVTGSNPTPYRITIQVAQLSNEAWAKAIAGMAEKAQFAAELLADQMPQQIDEVFRAAGTSLFPTQRVDLKTKCSCPDWGDPCKHVAATHYVLGEAFDRDPFLLFALRGRTKEQVLDALRAARAGESTTKATAASAPSASVEEVPIPSMTLEKVKAADYDRPREALPALHFSFDEPVAHGAILRQLGVPSGWTSEATPEDVLAPLVRDAAAMARSMAMAEAPGEGVTIDASPVKHTKTGRVPKRK